MFGYVTANEPELKVKDYHKYKAYYCGLCQSLKRQYGSAAARSFQHFIKSLCFQSLSFVNSCRIMF